MKRLVILAIIALATESLADVDDIEQSWPSPNGRFIIHHTAHYDHRLIDWQEPPDSYALKAAYTLTNHAGLLWSAESPVDESAHEFHCAWAGNSKWALILERPARGDVQIFLVSTATPAQSDSLHLQRMIDHVEAQAGDSDDRHLQKAWFGEWKFAQGRFEGIVIVAKKRIYRVHLILDPSAKSPRLRLIDVKTAEAWEESLRTL